MTKSGKRRERGPTMLRPHGESEVASVICYTFWKLAKLQSVNAI